MPSDDNEICFRGDSTVECEGFLQQVYSRAWKEGRTRDGAWIADFVSTCFKGEALWWYIKLPLETRRDWELLQSALSERWHSENDETKPTPAAAAPPVTSPSFNDEIGRLRAKVNRNDTAYWVSAETQSQSTSPDYRKGSFILTNHLERALNVQIIPLANQVYRMKIVNHPSGCGFLAMYIPGSLREIYGFLIGVDAPHGTSLREHRSTYQGEELDFEFKSDIWSFDQKEQALTIYPEAAGESEGCIYFKLSSEDTCMFDHLPASSIYPGIDLFFEPLGLNM